MWSKLLKLFDIHLYKKLYSYTKGYRLVLLLITFTHVLYAISEVFIALLTKNLIDAAVSSNIEKAIEAGLNVLLLFLINLLLSNFLTYYSMKSHTLLVNDIQLRTLSAYYNKKWYTIMHFRTGDILTRLSSDVTKIIDVWITYFPSILALGIQLIVAFSLLYYYDPTFAILTLCLSPIAIILSWFVGRKLKNLQHEYQSSEGQIKSHLDESLHNLTILKTFQITQKNLNELKQLQDIKYSIVRKRSILQVIAHTLLGIAYRLGYFGAIAFGAYRILTKHITFGTFTAFIQLTGQIQGPMTNLAHTLPQVIASMASMERILLLENYEDETKLPVVSEIDHINPRYPIAINMINIHFAYTPQTPIFHHMNFKINKGEKVAIIGPSGEGKTTLTRLLLSLLEPNKGTIHYHFSDGTSEDFTSDSRRFLSYVPQNNTLFSGTIWNNLLIANPQATPSAINRCLETACADEFINQLPEGLNTVIGENTVGLSEGQAQRLSIARALLQHVPFIIFDEATSALDSKTEERLINNLSRNYPDIGLIAVTHKDSIFRICDKVYELKNNSLEEVVG